MARDSKAKKSGGQHSSALIGLSRLVARRAARDAMEPRAAENQCLKAEATQGPKYLRVTEVARLCGVSDRTVWRWIAQRTLKSAKVGRIRRVERSDLERLMRVDNVEES